jgi:sugar fermentation stimulation protein A
MRLTPRPVEGAFVARVNRFAAEVTVDGGCCRAHVPNSGRMHELLVPAARVALTPRDEPGRKTPFDLTLVYYAGRWVGVDSRMPPRLAAEALGHDLLPGLVGARVTAMEPAFGGGRLDLAAVRVGAAPRAGLGPGPSVEEVWLIETKSCNLVEDGTALFPDAPTLRGTRHLTEMAAAARRGTRLALWFVIQRDDAQCLAPFAARDEAFAHALGDAVDAGVLVGACVCRVSATEMRVVGTVPVVL